MDTLNYGLPTILSSFLVYLNDYLVSYREFYKKSELSNVQLKYLTEISRNLVTINCCIVEPNVSVGDFWYNGKLLRFCSSNVPLLGSAYKKSYTVIYKYEDAFESALLSLNTDFSSNPVTTTPKPIVTTTIIPSSYLKLTGGEMLGPILLSREAKDPREPVTKNAFDIAISGLNVKQTKIENNLNNTNQQLDIINNYYAKVISDVYSKIKDYEVLALNQSDLISNLSNTIDNLNLQVQKLSVSKVYTHTQSYDANTWLITHLRGSTNFIYSIYNDLDEVIIPDSIKIIDIDTIAVTFLVPIKGTVVLNFE